MPEQVIKHRSRAFVYFLVAVVGTALLVWACTQRPLSELLLLAGIFFSVPMWTLGCVSLWQASAIDKLMKPGNALASWSLSLVQQEAHAQVVYEKEKSQRVGAVIAGGLLFTVALVMKFTTLRDMDWGLFLVCMLGVAAILTYVALVMPWMDRWQSRGDAGDVVIGPCSAVIPGKYVIWHRRQLGMIAEQATAVNLTRDGAGDALMVHYKKKTRYSYTRETCRIPVPDGKQEEAAQVGREIAKACNVIFSDEISGTA